MVARPLDRQLLLLMQAINDMHRLDDFSAFKRVK